jgi:hypothetical protein
MQDLLISHLQSAQFRCSEMEHTIAQELLLAQLYEPATASLR